MPHHRSGPSSGSGAPTAWRPRVAGALLIMAAAANAAFLLGPLIGVALDPIDSFVSGLSAQGSRHAGFFRVADLVTGGLLLAGVMVGRQTVPGTPWLRLAGWAMALFAVCTAADSLLPMDCDPGGDAACRAAEAAGAVSWRHQAHSATGVLESTATVAAALGLGLGTRHAPGWRSRSRMWLAAAGALAALAAAISVMYLAHLPGVGLVQRLSVLVWAGAVALAGWSLWRRDMTAGPPRPWPVPDPSAVRTLAVAVPGQPGTVVRVEVHHPQARRVAVVSGGLGLPLDLWHPVAAALPEVRLVLVDRPGLAGSTPWAVPPTGLSEQVAVLDAALDAAGVAAHHRVVVVGHSYGGLLAEAYARRRPQRVEALVLVDPSDPSDEAGHGIGPRTRRLADRALRHPRVARTVGRVVAWVIGAAGTARLDGWVVPGAVRARHRTSRHLRAGLLELSLIGPEAAELVEDSRSRPEVGCPTHMLIARWGGWPLYRVHRRWVAQLTARAAQIGARTTVVDAAHLLMLDDPAAVADVIRGSAQGAAGA